MKYFLFIMFIFLYTCDKEHSPENNRLEILVNEEKEFLLVSSIVEYFDVIPLETNDDNLISQIDKVKIINDKFFVLDIFNNAIFIFDKKGNHIQTLFRVGNGPGEYLQLIDFDLYDDLLYILDFAGQSILIYDMELTFKDKISYETFSSQINISNNSFILYNEPSGRDNDYQFSIIDKNGAFIKGELPRLNSSPPYNYGGISVFSKVNEYSYISPIYGNIIYGDDEFEEIFQIRFSQNAFPSDQFIGDYDIFSPDFLYLIKNHFFVTEKFFLFDYDKDNKRFMSVFDRVNRELNTGEIKNDMISNFRFFPRWSNNGYLIEEVDAGLIYEHFQFMLKFPELLELKREDNPIIILYKLKQ